eukprot:2553774-Rhodomonas_salina.1
MDHGRLLAFHRPRWNTVTHAPALLVHAACASFTRSPAGVRGDSDWGCDAAGPTRYAPGAVPGSTCAPPTGFVFRAAGSQETRQPRPRMDPA